MNILKCCKDVRITGMGFIRFKQCSRKGVIEHNGKYYCNQHNPIAVKEKRKKREARWLVEQKKRRLELAAPAFLNILKEARGYIDVSMIRTSKRCLAKWESLAKRIDEIVKKVEK